MSTYALQTKTMICPVHNSSIQLVGLSPKHDKSNPHFLPKRKRETTCGLQNFTQTFTIQQQSRSPFDRPAAFKPVRIIHRSQLPLTFLDTSTDENFAANALICADISVLEPEENKINNGDLSPKILVVQHETESILYAIERVQQHVYSICKLAKWLKEEDVADLWDPSNQIISPRLRGGDANGVGVWWQHAMVETCPVEPVATCARIAMMRPKPTPMILDHVTRKPAETQRPRESDPVLLNTTDEAQESQTGMATSEEQIDLLLRQYLDTVYLSKTSLAYFAKGPITRMRNNFTSSSIGAPSTQDMSNALRSMLLSSKAGEKKYHEKLPNIVKAIPPGSLPDDDTAIEACKGGKLKRKAKLGREGIYPHEGLMIKKWWLSELPNCDNVGMESFDQRIKRRIGNLRVRETLAQLILMLEIIALDTLFPPKADQAEGNSIGDTQAQNEPQVKTQKRKKKMDDIPLQLDLLLDKLSIWHATEEIGILEFDSNHKHPTEYGDKSAKNGANDRLHDFCVEVIIPFFMNRLPEQALMVNKKLGGPVHILAPKRKAVKPSTTSRRSEEAKAPTAKKIRRSLTRVATDLASKPSERKTPFLTRSATDSTMFTNVKREGSEVPLSTIPFQRSPSKSARSSMSQMRHLHGRQIDLSAPCAAAAAKVKQKQRVEEDLQDAILALTKPNRGLAVESYIADNQRHKIGQISKSRKPANPVRKMFRDVQVSATPRVGRRSKNMIEQTPHRHVRHGLFAQHTGTEPSPADNMFVPSSTMRPSLGVAITGRTLAHSSVAETPSKAAGAKEFVSGPARRIIFATPSKNGRFNLGGVSEATREVIETSAEKAGMSPRTTLHTLVTPARIHMAGATDYSEPREDKKDTCIYDTLGWDNDDDFT